jgi:hypothetical protein
VIASPASRSLILCLVRPYIVLPLDKLPPAARRILNCANQMFAVYFWKTVIQPQLLQRVDFQKAYVGLERSTVESSLLAIRAFDDFARDGRSRADDLVASDFPGFSPTFAGIAASERNKINKKIMHLTHLDLAAPVEGYSYKDALAAVVPVAVAFCDHIMAALPDTDRLHQFAAETKVVCERVRSEYIDR